MRMVLERDDVEQAEPPAIAEEDVLAGFSDPSGAWPHRKS
jgi:hypothetical protein